jgi:hypothetical protein
VVGYNRRTGHVYSCFIHGPFTVTKCYFYSCLPWFCYSYSCLSCVLHVPSKNIWNSYTFQYIVNKDWIERSYFFEFSFKYETNIETGLYNVHIASGRIERFVVYVIYIVCMLWNESLNSERFMYLVFFKFFLVLYSVTCFMYLGFFKNSFWYCTVLHVSCIWVFFKILFGIVQCYMFHNLFFVYDIVCVLSAYTYVRIDLLICFIFQSLVKPREIVICVAG